MMRRVLPWIPPLVALAVWEAVAKCGVIDRRFLPPVEQIAGRAVLAFRAEDMAGHLFASLQRDIEGFVIGAAIGSGLGLLIGLSRPAQRVAGPLLVVHRQIALFAWIPLLSLWFGGGEPGKVAFIAMAAFQPALTNAWRGAAEIPASYKELADVLMLSRLDRLRLVSLPAALPGVFTGLQTALIYAWVATIGAELFLNVAPGLGGRMNEGQQLFQMDLLLLCVMLMGAVGLAFNLLAARLQTRLLRWRPS